MNRAPVPGTVGSVGLNVAIFGAFVVVTLGVVYRVGRTNRTVSEFYAAGRALTGMQNGVAIAGDYLSAASFLGIAGLILAYGADMLWFPVGYTAGYLVLLVLVAAPLRGGGKGRHQASCLLHTLRVVVPSSVQQRAPQREAFPSLPLRLRGTGGNRPSSSRLRCLHLRIRRSRG